MRQPLSTAILLAMVVVSASACAADPSAQYFPASQPTATQLSGDANGSAAGSTGSGTSVVLPHGPLARPDPKLTPGVVASTDLAAVCRQSKRAQGSYSQMNVLIAPGDQLAVLNAYKISALQAKHYGFDFLIPLQLGGANAQANIWPMPRTHGVGFHEKYVLNIRLHILVCHGEMALDQAQRAVASDWIKLWMRYGA
jgi:hypothetical protein